MNRSTLLIVSIACLAAGRLALAVDYPGPAPGAATGTCAAAAATLENDILAMRWTVADGRLKPACFVDKQSGATLDLSATECFRFALARSPHPQPQAVAASALKLAAPPQLTRLQAAPGAQRLGDRFDGWELSARWSLDGASLDLLWRAVLRDGANYVRQQVLISIRGEPCELAAEPVALELAAAKVEVVGSVDGSPLRAGNVFAACEHPLARNQVQPGDGSPSLVRCVYPYAVSLTPGHPFVLGGVIGAVPEGQLRRGFLHYLERERSQPYHTFLHDNCGYALGARFWQLRRFGTPDEVDQFVAGMEKAWLERIALFGREMIEKRGAVIDSFVCDHGWDDTELVWQFHKGFPQGLANVQKAAAQYHSSPGIWFSPWGGYSGRSRRVEAGLRQGFETTKKGLSLAGPRYYARFRQACLGMVRDFGVNYFKFDGFATGGGLPGPGDYPGDVDALLTLCEDLRHAKPGVFLNPTSGTWPSPF